MKWLFIILLTFALGCQDNSEPDYTVFRYNQPNPITSLDPAFAKSQNNIWAVNQLFNTLVKLDSNLNIQPCIAKSWKALNDGRQIIFNLRNDVFFHEDDCFGSDKTRTVTANDVVYSLDRLVNDSLNSPGAWLFKYRAGELPLFEAQDDSTFIINLNEAFMPLLGVLTMQYCSILPKEAVTYYGIKWRSHPVGTGPFKLKRWIEDQALFIERNDLYFDTSFHSNIDYVKTVFITDKQIALYELLRGKLDFISGLESSYVNDLLTKEGVLHNKYIDILKYRQTPYLNTEYLGINMKLAADHPYLSLKEFRQALNYSIDKRLMLKSLRNNVGIPAENGIIPSGLPSFQKDKTMGYTYQPDLARQLLSEINYDGSVISIQTNNEYLDLCTFVAKQWEKVGIPCNIEVKESAVLRDGMRKGGVSIFRASWIADYPDGESFLCMFYGDNPAPPNYTQFKNEQFDELYELAITTSEDSVRLSLYQRMDSIIIEEAPVVFLFYDASSVFYNPHIEGYTNNGLNLLNVDFSISK